MLAVKRGAPDPLLDDVSICVQLGWTHDELMDQPARFIDRVKVYLNTVADMQRRETERLEEELHRHSWRRPR